jgi:hypothetical protein
MEASSISEDATSSKYCLVCHHSYITEFNGVDNSEFLNLILLRVLKLEHISQVECRVEPPLGKFWKRKIHIKPFEHKIYMRWNYEGEEAQWGNKKYIYVVSHFYCSCSTHSGEHEVCDCCCSSISEWKGKPM